MARQYLADRMSANAARTTVELTYRNAGQRSAPDMDLLEMQARGIQNALRLLLCHRASQGRNFGNLQSWVAVAADVAAGRFKRPTARHVEAVCSIIGLPINASLIAQAARQVAALRLSEGDAFRMMDAEAIGIAVELTAAEREGLGITKIGSMDESPEDRTRRLNREAKRRRRGSKPRRPSTEPKPWEAMGISKTTFYDRGLHKDRVGGQNVLGSIKKGKEDNSSGKPGKEDNSSGLLQDNSSAKVALMGKEDNSSGTPGKEDNSSGLSGVVQVEPPPVAGQASSNPKNSANSEG